MPSSHVLIESPIEPSFRVEQVRGMFDVPEQSSIRHEWDVDIPIEGTDWQIGLIVGPSGSGKTTIGRRLFPDAHFHAGYQWPDTGAVVDGFPAAPRREGDHRRLVLGRLFESAPLAEALRSSEQRAEVPLRTGPPHAGGRGDGHL